MTPADGSTVVGSTGSIGSVINTGGGNVDFASLETDFGGSTVVGSTGSIGSVINTGGGSVDFASPVTDFGTVELVNGDEDEMASVVALSVEASVVTFNVVC